MLVETEQAPILTPSPWTTESLLVEHVTPDPCWTGCSNCPLTVELTKQRWGNAYWHKMHQRAVEREAKLKKKIAELEAKLRLRERQLFARKSEKGGKQETAQSKADEEKKPRGQQKGSHGHGRRDHSHLPAQEEIRDIPENERRCPGCGLPFELFPGTEDCEVIEIEVKAYRRTIRRKRYKRTCQCGAVPGIVTAPPAPKLIPKGIFGISVWVMILLDKFLFLRPTYRFSADLKTHGLDIAQGTTTDGLKTIAPLFDPIYEALIARNVEENRWHADETRWPVFATIEGKVGSRWYMWVFRSPSTVVYRLNPSRSSEVPKAHFGLEAEGILSVDRYAAYKAMVKNNNIRPAFCWGHVRRDFLDVAKDRPNQEAWGLGWVEAIGNVYHLNDLCSRGSTCRPVSGSVEIERTDVLAGLGDVCRITVDTVDQAGLVQAEDRGQRAVPAADMDDESPAPAHGGPGLRTSIICGQCGAGPTRE